MDCIFNQDGGDIISNSLKPTILNKVLKIVFLPMKHYVYVIFSVKLNKYYVGFTVDIPNRLNQHNSGISTFTSRGIPWELIYVFECESIDNARVFEKQIKGRGIARYLKDKDIL